MAARKMTFTIPEDVAVRFERQVPARDRSHYVAQAIAAQLRESEERLIRACEVANTDPEGLRIEQEWDELNDEVDQIEEPWDVAPPLLIPVMCGGRPAVAVTDQIRAVSKQRLDRFVGTASREELEAVEQGVREVLDLG